MLRDVGGRFIWYLIKSTIFATFIGYVLYKAGLISFSGIPKSQKALNNKEHTRSKRVGRIRVT